jgi:hypothetical protein
MTMKRIFLTILLFASVSSIPHAAIAADTASGYFRLGEQRIEPRHAVAVRADSEAAPGEAETWIYLGVSPFDAAQVAAAFDPDDGVREQASDEPSGSYVKLCVTADGHECGIDFAHRGPSRNFSSGGHGELTLIAQTPQRIAGTFKLLEAEDFFEETYQFDLAFDVGITPPPGNALPAGGGEPGKAYQVYLTALAQGDFDVLRELAGESGAYRFPEEDPTSAKETLRSLRDEQPVVAEIARGRGNGDQAVLWVKGEDRDDIMRAGRVLMKRTDAGWRFEEAELDAVD